MNFRLALRTVFLCLLGLAPLAATAQQISSILVQPASAAVGEPVSITVYLEPGDAPPACGLRVDLGDGSFRQLRADEMHMPVTLSHTYSRGGEFSIRATGDLYVRGLRTAFACRGAKSAAIGVVDVAAERKRQEAEMEAQAAREREQREQREAAVRQAQLAQQKAEREAAQLQQEVEAKERALRQREAEVRRLAEQRDREFAERAETLRQMELEVAAREKALRDRERAARTPARTAARAPSGQASSGSSRAPSQKSAKPPSASAPRGTLDAF